MKAIMVMFDSLNRHMLPPYGCQWVQAPNFSRLAQRTLTFEKSYVASMPCMPARRDLHTGRPGFLHRGWGPLEPFDDSCIRRMARGGVYTHLCSDHYHYWEAGGSTYHTQYNSWEFFRGQEGDPWLGRVGDVEVPANINGKGRRQDWVNRSVMTEEPQYSQPQTMQAGLDFLRRNRGQDNWFLQIECFDPHEPFVSPAEYLAPYDDAYRGDLFDWPGYGPVTESAEQVAHLQHKYAALVSMCDRYLGQVLDVMDEQDLWHDTMLIVWTDHGFLLGEHGCWAKNWPPLYEEVSHTPFFLHDPRHPAPGERRQALVQPALDLCPTLLSFFGLPPAPLATGQDLAPVVREDREVREAALFGYFGDRVNITDGRYVLYEVPADMEVPRYEYTLLPLGMKEPLRAENFEGATLERPLDWTGQYPVLKLKAASKAAQEADGRVRSLLYDLQEDPHQASPLQDEQLRGKLRTQMAALLAQNDAPPELFRAMALAPPV